MRRLDGKVALVTGSTRGLGEAIAVALAAEGARIAVTGRAQADGDRVVQRIAVAGDTAQFVPLDLCDEQSIETAFATTADAYGRLDILVNNAAPVEFVTGSAAGDLTTKVDDTVTEITLENWRKITAPAIDGLMLTLKYGIRLLQATGGGSIINISSVAAIRGTRGVDAYTASKGAMNALTLSTAATYAPAIRSNCLVAGPFLTDGLAPLMANPAFEQAFSETLLSPGVGLPEQMASAVVFFASDESAYITGQIVPVDGGMSVPAPVPKLAAPAEA